MNATRVFSGCAAFAFYFICAGTLSSNELIAGVLATGIALAFLALYRRVGKTMCLQAPWGSLAAAVLNSIVLDSFRVGKVLLRSLSSPPSGPTGLICDQRFEVGTTDSKDAGRRALVILAVSLAPNKYVVREDRGREDHGPGRLVMHELVHADASTNVRWPL